MVLAFLVPLVTVVLTGEREREPGGRERWAKEGIQGTAGEGREREGDGREELV